MLGKIVCGAILTAAIFGSAPANAMTMRELRAGIDRDLKEEILKMPLGELYSMQETGFPEEDAEKSIGARSQKERLNSMPDFARRALFKNYARFMNEWLEDIGLQAALREYEKYTKLDIRFNIEETHRHLPAENQTPIDVIFGAKMTMQPSANDDFHLGMKFDPQGIDAKRFNNFTAFIERDCAWLRAEARYSSVNNFSLTLQKNSAAPDNFLDLLLEYKYADNRLYADIVYELERGWRLKLFGSYGVSEKSDIFVAIFRSF